MPCDSLSVGSRLELLVVVPEARRVRRFPARPGAVHQFAEALLVVENPDRLDRPVNSPQFNYQITTEALAVIQVYGTSAFDTALASYLKEVPGLKAKYAAAREMNRIPVAVPGGKPFVLSPGGQNVLIK